MATEILECWSSVALWSTQPLREMSSRILLGGKGRPARMTANITATSQPIF
jgi:hypothetical protein